jgi:hypothetical protein
MSFYTRSEIRQFLDDDLPAVADSLTLMLEQANKNPTF